MGRGGGGGDQEGPSGLCDLPSPLLALALSCLDPPSLAAAGAACRALRDLVEDPSYDAPLWARHLPSRRLEISGGGWRAAVLHAQRVRHAARTGDWAAYTAPARPLTAHAGERGGTGYQYAPPAVLAQMDAVVADAEMCAGLSWRGAQRPLAIQGDPTSTPYHSRGRGAVGGRRRDRDVLSSAVIAASQAEGLSVLAVHGEGAGSVQAAVRAAPGPDPPAWGGRNLGAPEPMPPPARGWAGLGAHLTVLVLRDLPSLDDGPLAQLFSAGLPSLRRLDLRGCAGLTDSGVSGAVARSGFQAWGRGREPGAGLEAVDISGTGAGASSFEALAAHVDTLKELSLDSLPRGPPGPLQAMTAAVLAGALERLRGLEELSLRGADVAAAGGVLPAVGLGGRLRRLCLRDTTAAGGGEEAAGALALLVARAPLLRSLDTRGAHWSAAAASEVAEGLAERGDGKHHHPGDLSPASPRLSDLRVGWGWGDAELHTVARGCPMLRHVTLGLGSTVTDGGLASLASACPLLETLSLRFAQVSPRGVTAAAVRCGRLRRLAVRQCGGRIGDEELVAIAASCLRLCRLSITGAAAVGDLGVSALGGLRYLEELELVGCQRLGDAGLLGLAAGPAPLLRLRLEEAGAARCCAPHLPASMCPRPVGGGVSLAGLVALLESRGRGLQALRLRHLTCPGGCGEGLPPRTLVEIARLCPLLREVVLDACDLRGEGPEGRAGIEMPAERTGRLRWVRLVKCGPALPSLRKLVQLEEGQEGAARPCDGPGAARRLPKQEKVMDLVTGAEYKTPEG